MKRRVLFASMAAVALSPGIIRAQQTAMKVIGYLNPAAPSPFVNNNTAAFLRGLSEVGYVEGRNLTVEYRWAQGRYDRLPALAADLVARKVDLLVASAGAASARAAKAATATIPVVFTSTGDPVGVGLVDSLARPGGNVTGVSVITSELEPKRLDLLSQLVHLSLPKTSSALA